MLSDKVKPILTTSYTFSSLIWRKKYNIFSELLWGRSIKLHKMEILKYKYLKTALKLHHCQYVNFQSYCTSWWRAWARWKTWSSRSAPPSLPPRTPAGTRRRTPAGRRRRAARRWRRRRQSWTLHRLLGQPATLLSLFASPRRVPDCCLLPGRNPWRVTCSLSAALSWTVSHSGRMWYNSCNSGYILRNNAPLESWISRQNL